MPSEIAALDSHAYEKLRRALLAPPDNSIPPFKQFLYIAQESEATAIKELVRASQECMQRAGYAVGSIVYATMIAPTDVPDRPVQEPVRTLPEKITSIAMKLRELSSNDGGQLAWEELVDATYSQTDAVKSTMSLDDLLKLTLVVVTEFEEQQLSRTHLHENTADPLAELATDLQRHFSAGQLQTMKDTFLASAQKDVDKRRELLGAFAAFGNSIQTWRDAAIDVFEWHQRRVSAERIETEVKGLAYRHWVDTDNPDAALVGLYELALRLDDDEVPVAPLTTERKTDPEFLDLQLAFEPTTAA